MTRRKRAASETATERVELRLTPAQAKAWRAAAAAEGRTLTALIEAAVEHYAVRGDEGRLAELGAAVVALVEQRRSK